MEKPGKVKKTGTIMITIGLLLIAGALSLTIYNILESRRAVQSADHILKELYRNMEEISIESEVPNLNKYERTYADYELKNEEMPTIEIDGRLYIGILEIPDLDIELPVMANWSYESLELSPCRYSGSYFTKDMVICAHNYFGHFAGLGSLGIGRIVNFKTVDGFVYQYKVNNSTIVQPFISEIEEDENREWDLTLFTCNYSGQARIAVRCVLEQ